MNHSDCAWYSFSPERSADNGEQFAEALDEVYIYNRALTDAEVLKLYAADIDDSAFGLEGGLAGEGQTWKRTERFTLANRQLNRRTDAEPGQEPPVNLTYTRCGGQGA